LLIALLWEGMSYEQHHHQIDPRAGFDFVVMVQRPH